MFTGLLLDFMDIFNFLTCCSLINFLWEFHSFNLIALQLVL